MTTMDHPRAHAELASLALDDLSPQDREQVEGHLQRCAGCREELAGLIDTLAALYLVVPARAISPERSAALRTALLRRAALETSPLGLAHRRPGRGTAWALSGWAVAAALAGLLVTHHGFHRPVDYGWIAAGALLGLLLATGAYALHLRRRLRKSGSDDRNRRPS